MEVSVGIGWALIVIAFVWSFSSIHARYFRGSATFIFLVGAVLLVPAALLLGRYGAADCAGLKDEYACRCFAIAAAREASAERAQHYFSLANERCPGYEDYATRAGTP